MATLNLLDSLLTRTEKLIENQDEDEKVRRSALSSLRKQIEMARAEQEDVSKYQAALARLETKFRADISDSAMRSAATYANKRVALLSSKQSQRRQDVLGRADLLAQSRDANESLIRTRNMMVKELSRVNEVSTVLLADSEKLRDVGGEYTQYGSALKTSRDLLKTMQRRENTDRMLLGFGFLFFILVVLYILKRRLLPFFSPIAWLIETLAHYATSNNATLASETASETLKSAHHGEL